MVRKDESLIELLQRACVVLTQGIFVLIAKHVKWNVVTKCWRMSGVEEGLFAMSNIDKDVIFHGESL